MRTLQNGVLTTVLAIILVGCSTGGADGMLGMLGIAKDRVCLNTVDEATIATFKTYACGGTSISVSDFYNKVKSINEITWLDNHGQETDAPSSPSPTSTFEMYFVKKNGSIYQMVYQVPIDTATVLVAQLAGI